MQHEMQAPNRGAAESRGAVTALASDASVFHHTFATLALQNGVDVKTVSSMLGHFDAGLTLRTYTHVTRQMQESTAEKMGNFMAQVM